jgi:hypothetical protein
MLRHRKKTFVLTFGPIVAGVVLYAGFMQSTDERLVDLEDRVLRLEATVSVLAQASQPVPTEQTAALHTITGVYLERPEQITGSECNTFYPTGTTVFLSDWDGQVLGTSELGDGVLGPSGLCSQPFDFTGIPDSPGYVFNIDRRVSGSAYEFTFEQLQESDWVMEVRSRYRQ